MANVTEPFCIDERLLVNTTVVKDLSLCQVLLHNDQRYPWFILVPRIPHVIELYELSDTNQHQLLHEIILLSHYIKEQWAVHKINIATLGNIVPQLHMHVVGRNPNDAAWPDPVWGKGVAEPYAPDTLIEQVQHVQGWLDMMAYMTKPPTQ